MTRPSRSTLTPETFQQEVHPSPEQLERCMARYELAPGLPEVTHEGERLYSKATGQAKVQIFAESENESFLKVVDAQLSSQIDEAGPAKRQVLLQSGRDMKAKRLE